MGKHPFPEVPSTLLCHTVHFGESLAQLTQRRASLQLLGGAQFSKRLPSSIFWGEVCVHVGAVEAQAELRITAAQPSDICSQFFTSAKKSLSVPVLDICIFFFRTSTHFFLWVPPCIYV